MKVPGVDLSNGQTAEVGHGDGELHYSLVEITTHADKGPRYLLRMSKVLRSRVVAAYMREAGYRGAVVFSCGNASDALRAQGVRVLAVAPNGDLQTTRWWEPAEIHRTWPELLDATSGHLPVHCMVAIAREYRLRLGELNPDAIYEVLTGSGETITCLRWAYPRQVFLPVSDGSAATERDERSPLRLVSEAAQVRAQ